MQSMTGFGSALLERDGRKVSLEIKSVNHRYLDLNIRLPRTLAFTEATVQKVIKERLERGHVDVFVHYQNLREDAKEVVFDHALAKAYVHALEVMSQDSGLTNDMTVTTLSRLPDVFTVVERPDDEQAVFSLVEDAVNTALDGLVNMRMLEGEQLVADINTKLKTIDSLVEEVKVFAPMVVPAYRDRLQARIAELMAGGQLDASRLATEVSLFADRSSIDEELVRLDSHLGQMRDMLCEQSSVGRKLDFIVQEINREVNTICSKANDLQISKAGLALKNEVEKIREQVQNIQ